MVRGSTLSAKTRGRGSGSTSDIYSRTPFVFRKKTAFDALCSDISTYRVAEAVAASAAVPLAFAPIIAGTFPGLRHAVPAWIERARRDPSAQPMLRSFAEAPSLSRRFDAFVSCSTAASSTISAVRFHYRAARGAAPFQPMTERQAVRCAADRQSSSWFSRNISRDFAQQIEGPTGVELVSAAADTAIDASVRSSYARRSRHWLPTGPAG